MEAVVGIIAWSMIITGFVLFITGFLNGFIIWIVGLMFIGFANFLNLFTTLFFFAEFFGPEELLLVTVTNLVLCLLNLVFGIIFLIWGFVSAGPFFWVTGILLLLCVGLIVLALGLGNMIVN